MKLVTVGEVIKELEKYPGNAIVLVYEELPEVEARLRKCNSGIKIMNMVDDIDPIGFIVTGH